MGEFGRPDLLLKRYGVVEPKQIDLEALAWLLKAKVRYRSLDGCEAQIMGIRDRAIITVDPRFGSSRARFSLGHEIGHWQCHKNQNLQCSKEVIGSSRKGAPPKERQADKYAADLLMPAFMFEPRARAHTQPSFKTIGELAGEFSVSRTAAALRFIATDRDYSLLVCYGPNGRLWSRRSPHGPEKLIAKQDIDPDTDVYDLLFDRKQEAKNRTLEPASCYFNGRDVADEDVYSHSVLTGKRDNPSDRTVLTLIIPRSSGLIEAGERRDSWR